MLLEFIVNVDKKEVSHKIGKYGLVFRQGFAASQKFGSIKNHKIGLLVVGLIENQSLFAALLMVFSGGFAVPVRGVFGGY